MDVIVKKDVCCSIASTSTRTRTIRPCTLLNLRFPYCQCRETQHSPRSSRGRVGESVHGSIKFLINNKRSCVSRAYVWVAWTHAWRWGCVFYQRWHAGRTHWRQLGRRGPADKRACIKTGVAKPPAFSALFNIVCLQCTRLPDGV